MSVAVQTAEPVEDCAAPTFKVLGFLRTARRLMTGQVHVPRADLVEG
jgi:2-methylaconitate cis-trans-isomerase PrpF